MFTGRGMTPEAAGIASVSEDCECIGTLLALLETSLEFYIKGIRMRRDVVSLSTTSVGGATDPSGALGGERMGDHSGLANTGSRVTNESFASAVVDPGEAADYIALILSVAKRCAEEGTLQAVIFDSSFDVFQTLGHYINAPMRYAPVQRLTMREDAVLAFQKLRMSAISAQKKLVTYCAKNYAIASTNEPTFGGGQQHLVSLAMSAVRRYCIIEELMQLLKAPMTPEEVRKVVCETLFVICSHSGGIEYELMKRDFTTLLPMAVLEGNEEVRGYICAIAREVIGRRPTSPEIVEGVPHLLKLMSVDSSVEVRALCIDGLEEILRGHIVPSSPQEQQTARRLPLTEIVESIVARLDRRVEPPEVLELLCRLLESCVSLACKLQSDVVFRVCNDHNIHTHLLSLLERGPAVASHAARALRVLIERAPSFLSLSPRLVVGESMHLLLGAVIRLGRRSTQEDSETAFGRSRTEGGMQGVATQMLSVELAVIVGITLLYSPSNRRKFSSILLAVTGDVDGGFSMQEVLHHLHNCLTTGEIDYFAEMIITDEEGMVLNDPQGVDWIDETQPEQRSLHGILDAQDIRRPRNPAGVARWKVVESGRRRDLQRGYLAFVLLGYVVFRITSTKGVEVERQASPVREGLVSEGELTAATAGFTGSASPPQHQDARKSVSVRPPLFPTSKGTLENNRTRVASPSPRPGGNSEPPGDTPLGSSFRACFQLTTALSKYYQPTGSSLDGPAGRTKYVPAGGGLVMRNQKERGRRNPWDPKPIQRINPVWTVDAVREGDLFLFSIPLEALTATVIEQIVAKAERHGTSLRKAFITTPQRLKERRFFLSDALNSVIPQTVTLLRRLLSFLDSHSDQQVQLALGPLPDIKDQHMEKSVNPGNMIKCVDFLTSFFSKSAAVLGNTSFGGNSNSASFRASLQGGGLPPSGSFAMAASPISNAAALANMSSADFDDSEALGLGGGRLGSGTRGTASFGSHRSPAGLYSVSKSPVGGMSPEGGGQQYHQQVLGMRGQIGGELFPPADQYQHLSPELSPRTSDGGYY